MASTSGRMDGELVAIETPAQRHTVDIVKNSEKLGVIESRDWSTRLEFI